MSIPSESRSCRPAEPGPSAPPGPAATGPDRAADTPGSDRQPRREHFEHFWRYTNEIAGAVAMVIRQLDEREQAEVRRDLETALEGFKVGDGYEMPGVCINGLAR